MSGDEQAPARQRVDRWLWAARFFKTRSLARKAADLGRVAVNGTRARPARTVAPGDTLWVQCPAGEFTVTVTGLDLRRRPAAEACQLYRETEASRQARDQARERQRAGREMVAFDRGRPDRRERRAAIRSRREPPMAGDTGDRGDD